MDLQTYALNAPAIILLAPLVVAIVTIIKKTGLPSQFAPAAAIAVGVFLSLLLEPRPLPEALLTGLAIGATASGFYSYLTLDKPKGKPDA